MVWKSFHNNEQEADYKEAGVKGNGMAGVLCPI